MSQWHKAHLEDINETYLEHLSHASSFGFRMITNGFACLLHGIFPFLFVKTGSACIETLYDEMCVNRRELSKRKKQTQSS